MMTRYLEIGPRAYPLRFTARAILRTVARTGKPFSALFTAGHQGAMALLYCALLDEVPTFTLNAAANLMKLALRDAEDAREIIDPLLTAFLDSGFPREGIAPEGMDGLIAAARSAGYPQPERLMDMTLREINEALEGHLNLSRKRLYDMDALAWMQGAYAAFAQRRPADYPKSPRIAHRDAPMTDAQMQRAVYALAERQSHAES